MRQTGQKVWRKEWIFIFAAVFLALIGARTAKADAVAAVEYYTVEVETGYLALRNAEAYDYANEIGELYTGDVVAYIADGETEDYVYVYSVRLEQYGYVNRGYLQTAFESRRCLVRVATGYLALRSAEAYDYANEIGELYTGDTVWFIHEGSTEDYWYVYSATLDAWGYVNKNYLISLPEGGVVRYSVKVDTGYLALRNAEAYEYSNEIGKLYTGDTVWYISDGSTADYWYVYSAKLDQWGYVNKNYLVLLPESRTALYSVKVDTGYLALRSAEAYDYSNETGKLYTGALVWYISSGTTEDYWYVYSPDLRKWGYVNKNYLIPYSE